MLRYCKGFSRSTSFGGGVADDCGRCAGTAEAEMVRASTRRRTKLMRDARNVWNIRMGSFTLSLEEEGLRLRMIAESSHGWTRTDTDRNNEGRAPRKRK